MAAAKFVDTILKLLGQVTTTVSARLSRPPEEECLERLFRVPPRQRPNIWDKIDDPVVLVERNLHGHPLAARLLRMPKEECPHILIMIPPRQKTKRSE